MLAQLAQRLSAEGGEILAMVPSPSHPERLVVLMSPTRAERLRSELGGQLIVELDTRLQQYFDI
jgi:hypothetical protein